ncbi:Rcn1p ASCRUDRAFT_25573, partial [Ascoidea rubescens DSM 1968]
TNTLILTGFSREEIEDDELIGFLQQQIIDNSPNDELLKFTVLKSLQRILIFFEEIDTASLLYKILKKCDFKVYYSPTNNYDELFVDPKNPSSYYNNLDEYLRLPNTGTQFIISPPPSPPPGWVHRNEDDPNHEIINNPEELKDLLFQRLDD